MYTLKSVNLIYIILKHITSWLKYIKLLNTNYKNKKNSIPLKKNFIIMLFRRLKKNIVINYSRKIVLFRTIYSSKKKITRSFIYIFKTDNLFIWIVQQFLDFVYKYHKYLLTLTIPCNFRYSYHQIP